MLDQRVQRAHGFFNGRGRVKAVDLVEVDMIQLQARQAFLHAIQDVHTRIATRIHARASLAEHLCGNDDVVSRDLQIAQRLAGDDFRPPLGIDVGRVDKVDARFQGATDQTVGVFLLQVADLAPQLAFAAEGHGAQAEFRNEQAGAAKFLVSHGGAPSAARRIRAPRDGTPNATGRGANSMRRKRPPRAA